MTHDPNAAALNEHPEPGTAVMCCPRCPETMEASTEDPDATQSEMHHHLLDWHANYNRDTAYRLLAQVKLTGTTP